MNESAERHARRNWRVGELAQFFDRPRQLEEFHFIVNVIATLLIGLAVRGDFILHNQRQRI